MSSESKINKHGLETIERTRGCWSCIHWNNEERARTFWQHKRLNELHHADLLSKMDPSGEDCQQVVNIRRMVNVIDHSIASGTFGICEIGKAESDFVHNAYLCPSWSGRVGSSLVTSGTKADKLPEELVAERNNSISSQQSNRDAKGRFTKKKIE